jgi:hypothetical protein
MSLSRGGDTKVGKKNSIPDGDQRRWFFGGEWHDCPWCGSTTRVIFVHGHYECTACHRSVYDCCEGIMQQSTGSQLPSSDNRD